MGLGHAHDGDGPRREVASASVRRVLIVSTGLIGVAALVGLVLWWPGGDPAIDRDALGFSDRARATVVASEVGPCPSAPAADPAVADGDAIDCVVVTARLTSGPSAGDTAVLEASTDVDTPVSRLDSGDGIVVNDSGPDVPDAARFSFADMQRSTPLGVLAVLFALVVVALGRLKGLLALVGIVVSLGVLVGFIFPALLDGAAPIGVALTGATVIAFCTLYLAHGVNDRTTVALLGTMASLGLTAALAVGFAAAAQLSGLASEDSLTLLAFAPDLDFRGLLLAAVIIGTLGVLDDVTITQVSAVWELHRADSTLGAKQLYTAGIRIGRDHIASTVNTLVLAYAAAALPLLLIFTQSGLAFGDVLTTETVAVEIVQTLVGSIGLVASVPLTTALACVVITRSERAPDRRWSTQGEGPDEFWQRWPTPGPQRSWSQERRDTYRTNDPW